VIAQIGAMDVMFSLDTVITTVRMAKELRVMVTAICLYAAIGFSAAVETLNRLAGRRRRQRLAVARERGK
jgi:predicted tellurium resistance membrane protein TerC